MAKFYVIVSKDGDLISNDGQGSGYEYPTLYRTEEAARKFLTSYYRANTKSSISKNDMKKIAGTRVVEVEVGKSISKAELNETISHDLKDALIYNKLVDVEKGRWGYAPVAQFWLRLIKLGVEKDVTHICQAIPNINSYSGIERQKDLRGTVRGLGLKANQYRMSGDFMAFFNKDDAFNAKMCLNFKHFIDMKDIMEEVEQTLEEIA